MGELRDAEKEQLDALRIREGLGEAVGTAHAWSDLASVYVKQEHYKKAVEDAQKAMDVLGDDPKVDVEDRITVQADAGVCVLPGQGVCAGPSAAQGCA